MMFAALLKRLTMSLLVMTRQILQALFVSVRLWGLYIQMLVTSKAN
jgi:hypothetical protein